MPISISNIDFKRIKQVIKHPAFSIFVLLLLAILAYGLYVPWMGFYWDDWPWIWVSHILGPAGVLKIDAIHRPLSGEVLYLGSILFGTNPLGWQIYTLILRFLGALSLKWFLRTLWPENEQKTILVSLLFLLYPGFGQQFVSVNNSRHLFPLITFFLSLGFMVRANRKTKSFWVYSGLSLVLSTLTMLTTEYYYGLELIRPVVLGIVFYRQIENLWNLLVKVLKKWVPYFVFLSGVFAWRYSVATIQKVNYSITIFDSLFSSSQNTILDLLKNILVDFGETGFFAWMQIFHFTDSTHFFLSLDFWYCLLIPMSMIVMGAYLNLLYASDEKKVVRVKIGIIIGVAFSVCVILVIFNNLIPQYIINDNPNLGITFLFFLFISSVFLIGELYPHNFYPIYSKTGKSAESITLAIAALVLAPIPFWVTGLDPKLSFASDRLTLPMMFGSSLLVVGIIDFLIKRKFTKVLFFSLIIGLSIGFHARNAYSYRDDWNYQVDFFQQLTTRIPGLKPNTVILTHQLRGTRSTDNSLTAPLNWIYAPAHKSGNLPYSIHYIEIRFGKNPVNLNDNMPITRDYLFYEFDSSTRKTLLIYHQAPACLRVLDAELDHEYIISRFLPQVKESLPFSNPGQIIPDPDSPANLFEPLANYPNPKDWCYYYQKAALARQRGDWEQIAQIGEIALNQFNSTDYPSEYIPFIEGYAYTNRIDQAKSLTFKALETNEDITPMLCEVWDRIEKNIPPSENFDNQVEEIYQKLGECY